MLRLIVSCAVMAFVLVGCQSAQMGMKNPFANPFARTDQYEPEIKTTTSSEPLPPEEEPRSQAVAMMDIEPMEPAGQTKTQPVPDPVGTSSTRRGENPALAEMSQQADEALRAGKLSKATAFYREVLKLDPASVDANHRLAFIAVQQQNFDLAEKHYKQALALDPENVQLMSDLGYAYFKQGRYEESARFLNGAVQLDPRNSLALANLGLLAATVGDLEPAYQYFVESGMSPQEAQARIQEARLSAPQTTTPSSNPVANAPQPPNAMEGENFQSPSPDWASTYGITTASNPPPAAPQNQNGIRIAPDSQIASPGLQQVGNRQFGTELAGQPSFPQQNSSPQLNVPANYTLERAALNAGPGSLFPMTSPEMYERAQDPRVSSLPSPFEGQAQPIGFQQPNMNTAYPSYGGTQGTLNSPAQASPSTSSRSMIQTPINYEQHPSPHVGAPSSTMGQQFPVTGSPPPSAPMYSQFPGEQSASMYSPSGGTNPSGTTDPLRSYEEELRRSASTGFQNRR